MEYIKAKISRFSSILLEEPYVDILQFTLLLGFLFWLGAKSVDNLQYNWQWYQIPKLLFTWNNDGFKAGPLLLGTLITIKISAISLIFAFVIGLVTALLRLSESRVGRSLARIYLETMRNTPLLIQIFFIYFVFGPIIGLDRFPSAIVALSLFEGAYASEIFRSGILSIGKDQHEAADSIGLSTYQKYQFIILPQAIRKIIPPLASQSISLIKDSALVSTIAIYDLTMEAQALIAETYLTFEIWFTVALLYLMLTVTLSLFISYLKYKLLIDQN